jgi:hypothetical protein
LTQNKSRGDQRRSRCSKHIQKPQRADQHAFDYVFVLGTFGERQLSNSTLKTASACSDRRRSPGALGTFDTRSTYTIRKWEDGDGPTGPISAMVRLILEGVTHSDPAVRGFFINYVRERPRDVPF